MYTNRDLNQETMAAENLLYQRLIIFLIVFSVFVIGAVNTQRKILFISILGLGVIICWVLTFIVIRTAKRIDNKSGGRIVRLLLGYFVPVFCSVLLTTALFVGSFGFVDRYLFNVDVKPVHVENKIAELKNDIVKQISPGVKKSSDNFKSVDSVIAEGKITRSAKKEEYLNSFSPSTKAVTPKQNSNSKYFKSIDSIITIDKPSSAKRRTDKNNIEPKKTDTTKQNKSSKHFSDIEKVIQKGK